MATANLASKAVILSEKDRAEQYNLLKNAKRICGILYVLSLSVHIIQRCVFGFTLSPHQLGNLWQLPSTHLILEMPFKSFWYWHMAASGFVAYWSLLLNLFGDGKAQQAYQWINVFASSGLAPMAFVICLALCRNRVAAVATAIIVLLSPTLPLLAAYYLYDGPALYLLTCCTACIALYQLDSRRIQYLIAAIWLAAILVCIRSLYHFGLLIPLVAVIVLARPTRLQFISTLAAVSFPFTLYLKNWILFGVFGASTTLGLNFSKLGTWTQPPGVLSELKASGKIAPIVADYPLFYDIHARADIHAKYGYVEVSPNTMLNQNDDNNVNMITIARDYAHGSVAAIRANPIPYVKQVRYAFWQFCEPPSRGSWFAALPLRQDPYRAVYLNVVLGEWIGRVIKSLTGVPRIPSLVMPMLPLLIGGFLVGHIRRCGVSWRKWLDAFQCNPVYFVVIGLITYTMVLCCLLEVTENYRYFSYVEVIFFCASSAGIVHAIRRLRVALS